jgi:hypothetical protein
MPATASVRDAAPAFTISRNAMRNAPNASSAASPSDVRKISMFAAAVIAVSMGDSLFRRRFLHLHKSSQIKNPRFHCIFGESENSGCGGTNTVWRNRRK